MRKVKFKKFIQRQYKDTSCYVQDLVDGTGKWEDDFINDGLFNAWGVSYEQFESGAGNYTVALVEIQDGTIVEVLPSNLKFIS